MYPCSAKSLEQLTTLANVGILSNMKAILLLRRHIVYRENAFADLVLWRLPKTGKGSVHAYKYRLTCIVQGQCVLRYDNESGKGDHQHPGSLEERYVLTNPERLVEGFQRDIARWNHENPDS